MGDMHLDIGCGNKCKEGYVGLDKVQLPGVSIVADIEQGLPIKSASCKVVRAHHVFEHVSNLIGLMNEIHRVLMPGGRLEIGIPLVGMMTTDKGFVFGNGAYTDPSHCRFFVIDSFNYWQPGFVGNTDVGIRGNFKIISREVYQYPDDRFSYPSLNADIVLEKI